MGIIKYLKGDATQPVGNQGIISHISNDVGGWGSGFVTALSKKWSQPEAEYHRIAPKNRQVGNVQFVVVDDNLIVANMIAQNGLRFNDFGVPAVNYAAIQVCMEKVCKMADSMNVDVHAPRFGAGLSGGSWDIVEFVLLKVLRNYSCDIYVYDFDGNDNIVAKLN